MTEYRKKWKACKKWTTQICKEFLNDRAAMMAEKMKMIEEKALKVIISAKPSRRSYATINSILMPSGQGCCSG
jgi:hypothetical protein